MKPLLTILVLMGIFSRLFGGPDLNDRKEHIEEMESKPASTEARERKERSIEFLEGKNIPTIKHLPVIEDSEEANIRTVKEIAERLVGCTICAVGGETGDKEFVTQLIDGFGAKGLLTPEETDFVENGLGDQSKRSQFSWRYERSWVLLWALGHIEELDYQPSICDVPKLAGFLRDKSVQDLIEISKPRSKKEILDEADLIYRLHWAVTEERVNGSFELPSEIEKGVVLERHSALNWLIGYMDQSWDEITTDT